MHYSPGMSVTLRWLRCLQCTLDCLECTVVAESALWTVKSALADKFLHGAIAPANAYQCTKFQLSNSISFGDVKGVPK